MQPTPFLFMRRDGDILTNREYRYAHVNELKNLRVTTATVWNNIEDDVRNVVRRVKNVSDDYNLRGIRNVIGLKPIVLHDTSSSDVIHNKKYDVAAKLQAYIEYHVEEFTRRIARLVSLLPADVEDIDVHVPIDIKYLLEVVSNIDADIQSIATLGERTKKNIESYKENITTIKKLFDDIDRLLKAIEKLKEEFEILTGDLKHHISFKTAAIPRADYDFIFPNELPDEDHSLFHTATFNKWHTRDRSFRITRNASTPYTINLT